MSNVAPHTREEIVRNMIGSQALQIANLMVVADEVPRLKAEIARITAALEQALRDLSELRARLPGAEPPKE